MSYPERRGGKTTGHWYGETVHNRCKFRRRYGSKAEADDYEAFVQATGREPHHAPTGAAKGPTFSEVYLAAKAAGGPHRGVWTRARDLSGKGRREYVATYFGDLPIAALDTQALQGLVDHLRRLPSQRGRPMTPATINRYLDAASAVLTYAHLDMGVIPGKPKVPKLATISTREETLTDEQEEAVRRWLLEHGHRAEELCVRFLVATGFRRGEMFGLRPEQIANDHITLRSEQTKTDSPRTVFIEPSLADEMRALVASGQMPHHRHLLRIFKLACKSCGYSDELVLYSLRHTTATRLMECGVDTRIIQQVLGHSDISTTQRYTHVGNDMLREAAKKLSHRRGDLGQNSTVVPLRAPKISMG